MSEMALHSGDVAWIAEWLQPVKLGQSTMSQRALTSIEKHGGLQAVVKAARTNGVHLVKLTHDKGKILVAASLEPFETLC